MENYVFNLPSGVEVEIKELIGKHQRLLTENNKQPYWKKLNELLKDITVRIGSVTTIDDIFIDKMLAGDKKALLVMARQFTLDFLPEFVFNYRYVDSEGLKRDYPIRINTEDGKFTFHKMKIEKDGELVDANFEEYEDVLLHKDVFITLPKTEKEIRFTMLDGKGEKIGASIPKNKISTHTPIKMRRPVFFTGENKTPIQLNLDNLPYKDIEYLRSEIKKREPEVDTTVVFEHPESGQLVEKDILGMVAFFFPSEAI